MLLSHTNPQVSLRALQVLSDVCALSEDKFSIQMLKHGFLDWITNPDLPQQLAHQSIFCLSNIVADKNPDVLKTLIESNIYPNFLIPKLTQVFSAGVIDVDLAFCIGNSFLKADFDQVKYFVDCRILDLLVLMLKSSDFRIVLITLTAIKRILGKTKRALKMQTQLGLNHCGIIFTEFERLGGLDILEQL